MGIEVLILEKSTLSRREPFDTLGIYACPLETSENNDIQQFATEAEPQPIRPLRPSAMNQAIHRQMLARRQKSGPHGNKNQ
jgi:hypothetical protein